MNSKLTVAASFEYSSTFRIAPFLNRKIKCCAKGSPTPNSSSENKFQFKQLLGKTYTGWKLNNVDTSAVQETLSQWLSKTQNAINEVTSPLVKTVQEKKPNSGNVLEMEDNEDIFMAEQTVEKTLNGNFSIAAVVSIEQFSRMNGMTGVKMQKIFKALVPESINNDARNLVEYCCFRFLSRDSSEIHPCLKEPAFRRLIFVTMLAWGKPDNKKNFPGATDSEKASLKSGFVCEEAFVRIAPAVSGVADWTTAHNLFKALAGDQEGISYKTWSSYVIELLKVHDGRRLYEFEKGPQPTSERILCLGSSRKPPVLKWEGNMAWPGKLTLTDKALYFEGVGLAGKKEAIRLDLTSNSSRVEKSRVGPLGIDLFDSAISVSVGEESKPWVLEFVDLGGENRRDVWHAFVCEVISLYKFKQEFGPSDGDKSIIHVYGAQKGKERATSYAVNGIARLQALQYMHKILEDPIKLAPFSYLRSSPHGAVVCQTLAVNFWGGQLVTKNNKGIFGQSVKTSNEVLDSRNDVFDMDGSVYLRKWMRSPSWASSASAAFWKNSSVKKGIVLSKNLVVADKNLIEKAAIMYREKYSEGEILQATIDAAMIEGIPTNIDLFKELVFPLVMVGKIFEKLRHWEEPQVTVAFLAFVYAAIFRNMLSYIFPTTLIILATGMLLLKSLREQGRLGRYFGKIKIRDQPPSNTIQKILAVKEAMRAVEKSLQNLNISLLKMRTILLAGQPQVTTEVAVVLLVGSAILLTVPFKYILGFFVFDLFTRELEFRREMVIRFMSMIKERWDAVPAASVAVLPYESNDTVSLSQTKQLENKNTKVETKDK